jgi:hypothetical protein
MATIYSSEMTLLRQNRPVPSTRYGGKLRSICWDFPSLPAGNVGDVLVCGVLRQHERVLIGREYHSALSSGGGTATGSYGSYRASGYHATGQPELGAVDDVDRFLAATSFEAAGQNFIADQQAAPQGVGVGPMFDVPALSHTASQGNYLFLCLTNSVEAFATGGRVSGFVIVVGD